MKNNIRLRDNEEDSQFEIELEGGIVCTHYSKMDDTVFLTHTEVPDNLKGKGLASVLIKLILEDIKKKNKLLVAVCPFVESYIERHPEWNSIVK